MTHRQTWCDLHLPLVVVADGSADGGDITITRRAVGDSVTAHGKLSVLANPGRAQVAGVRRNMQLTLFPWFAEEERRALAATLHRCGITDCSLNWFDHGLPLLPTAAYAEAAVTLRLEIPGVHVWIGGHPGADSLIPRATDAYGREIAQLPSPEAVIATSPDLVAASERAWCEAVDADGIMVLVDEPSTVDTAATPAHCFSRPSRQRFARELGLPSVPEPLTILHDHREAWAAFAADRFDECLRPHEPGTTSGRWLCARSAQVVPPAKRHLLTGANSAR